MNKPKISLIAAIDRKKGLGKNNQLLFQIPQDLQNFKRLTLNHPVIMGRKTYQSIGRPLPDRTNIILTRDKNFTAENCIIVHSLDKAIEIAQEKDDQEIFIIGGGQIYDQTINLADKLYLTLVKGLYSADTFFPDYSAFSKIISKKPGQDLNYSYTFLELEKPSS